jgi:hypothetical protein
MSSGCRAVRDEGSWRVGEVIAHRVVACFDFALMCSETGCAERYDGVCDLFECVAVDVVALVVRVFHVPWNKAE